MKLADTQNIASYETLVLRASYDALDAVKGFFKLARDVRRKTSEGANVTSYLLPSVCP